MNAKMYLAGVVGGILCSLASWIPLAEYLPSTFLSDWGAVNGGLGWGFMLLACLIILACGAVSARLSGTVSRLGATVSSAVAGWIAALMSYILVGGSAAGVWGARPILEFGLKPAANEAQFIQLLVDNVTGIHWWTMLALWGMMLLGLGLGAAGGWLAGPGGDPDPDMTLVYQVVAVSGVLTSGLVLVIETAILTLLSQSTDNAAAKLGLVPAYSTAGILAFPVITTFLMMLASQLLWWFFYRRGGAAGQVMNMQVRLSAGILLGMPILALILVFLIYHQSMFYTLYLPFFVITILAGFGIMRYVWKNSTPGWSSTITFRIGMFSAGLSFLVMVAGAYFSTIPAALSDVMLVISPMTALTPEGSRAPEMTNIVELVREHYTTYRNAGLLLMLVVLPVFTLAASGLVVLLMKFFGRRAEKQKP
jgi:hypothetical protein